MECAHDLLTASNSLVANTTELSMRLSGPILHLSFCKSHVIAVPKNAWLIRLHNNWSKEAQAKVLTMIEDPLAVATASLGLFVCFFPFADENDWNVLKILGSLDVEGHLGQLQQVLKLSGSLGSWLHSCLQEMEALPRMAHLGNLFRLCRALLLPMDGCHIRRLLRCELPS